MKRRVLLLGPPASGKGTQASRLSRDFSIPHVSTGDLLRSECSRGTALGHEADSWTSRGLLVPDELAVRIIGAWIEANGPRFLLDGFPRTLGQARCLETMLAAVSAPVDLVVFLDLPESGIRGRILDRLTCPVCGKTYGATLHGLQAGGACPSCGGGLIRRNDDNEASLAERLRLYRELTLPVVDYYRDGFPTVFRRIDASLECDEIYRQLFLLVREGKER